MTLFDFLFTRVNFHDCYFPPLQTPSSLPSMITVFDAEGGLRQQLDSALPVSGGGLFVPAFGLLPSSSLPGFSGRILIRFGIWTGQTRLEDRYACFTESESVSSYFFTLFFYIYALKNLQANCLCSIQSKAFSY